MNLRNGKSTRKPVKVTIEDTWAHGQNTLINTGRRPMYSNAISGTLVKHGHHLILILDVYFVLFEL